MCHNKERLLYTEAACMLVSFVNTFLVGFSVLLAVKILIQDGGGGGGVGGISLKLQQI